MSRLFQNIRFGLRMLRRNPGITAAAWISLTLGIGSTTAIFSVVNSLLLQPLPYEAPDRLMLLWETDLADPDRPLGGVSEGTFVDWRQDVQSFEALSAVRNTSMSLTELEVPESPLLRQITATYFPIFGVEPLLGRNFDEEEEKTGAKVTILSYSLWHRQFGGDPSILGQTIELDYETYEVIGIMPASYRSPIEPTPPQLWAPLTLDRESLDRRRRPFLVYGRLKQGISLDTARQEVDILTGELRRLHPEVLGSRGSAVEGVQEVLVGNFRPTLLVLLGAGVFLLLIACGNVANLLLALAMARRKEIAVRSAMGAGRADLLRQLLTENMLLSLVGGISGLILAYVGIRPLASLVPVRFDLPRLDEVTLDSQVLLFALGLSVATGLFFGLVPARLAFSRSGLSENLSAGSVRSTAGRQGHFLRSLLVVAEISLSLVLLIGAGLIMQTFLRLSNNAPGYNPENVLSMRTGLRGDDYRDPASRIDFFRRAMDAIRAEPGVVSVAAISQMPLNNPTGAVRFTIEGMDAGTPGTEPEALLRVSTPGYFETLQVPLIQGRDFTDRDGIDAPRVAIVNQLFVDKFLGGRPVTGSKLLFADGRRAPSEIIGVVDNMRTNRRPPDPLPTFYLPHTQETTTSLSFLVRTSVEPESLSKPVFAAINLQDRLMPTYNITTLEKRLVEADWQSRFTMLLLSILATLALILAATGIYAVMASGVAERTREFGIRMAFGARLGDVLYAALRSSLRTAAIGLSVGLVASFFLSRVLEDQLYGVNSRDPLTFIGLTLILALVAFVASCIPALRATRVSPVVALRQE